MNQISASFSLECNEQIGLLEAAALQLEHSNDRRTHVDAAFRAVHRIKGCAAVVKHDELEWFSHIVESVLQRLRDGFVTTGPSIVSALLGCTDNMRLLVGLHGMGDEPSPEFAELDRVALIGMLMPFLQDAEPPAPPPVRLDPEVDRWHLSVRFTTNVLTQGLDPYYFLRYLECLGQVRNFQTVTDAVPELSAFDPECCYFGFELDLVSAADKLTIEDVFAMVGESCTLRIVPSSARVAEMASRMLSLPGDDLRLGEMLVRIGALTPKELAEGLRLQRGHDETVSKNLGDILIVQGFITGEIAGIAAERQVQIKQKFVEDSQHVKLPLDVLDRMIVLAEQLQGALVESENLAISAQLLQQLNAARAVRAGDSFGRLHRVVRDTGLELGKQVDLLLSGGELVIERGVADALWQVLVHLVRNAIDHGIESAEARLAHGKSPRGTLTLSLAQSDDCVILRCADDGIGLDRQTLLGLARERGLISMSEELDEDLLNALIFEPGLTTRAEVGRYSGRGVGLDAVREQVRSLDGEIKVTSLPGQGACFEIRIPRRSV